jgi:carbamoyl-phosphate synthase large subunit
LADHAGAHFAQWLLEEVLGQTCSANDDWRENVKMLRFDSAIYDG